MASLGLPITGSLSRGGMQGNVYKRGFVLSLRPIGTKAEKSSRVFPRSGSLNLIGSRETIITKDTVILLGSMKDLTAIFSSGKSPQGVSSLRYSIKGILRDPVSIVDFRDQNAPMRPRSDKQLVLP